MSGTTTATRPAIEWPEPIINDPRWALEDALSRLDRLHSLLDANNDDLIEILEQKGVGVWHIYELAKRDLRATNAVVEQIIEAVIITDFVPQTSVGKHTELRQRTDWAEAVNAYSAADAASVDTDNPDSVVDAAADAFKRLVDTRPPNLRCLHEKLTLIQTAGGWHTDGVIDAVFTDVEALARKHEIAGSAAQAEG